jgi:hypothetical protein
MLNTSGYTEKKIKKSMENLWKYYMKIEEMNLRN